MQITVMVLVSFCFVISNNELEATYRYFQTIIKKKKAENYMTYTAY